MSLIFHLVRVFLLTLILVGSPVVTGVILSERYKIGPGARIVRRPRRPGRVSSAKRRA